jgi:hypothetical protein
VAPISEVHLSASERGRLARLVWAERPRREGGWALSPFCFILIFLIPFVFLF